MERDGNSSRARGPGTCPNFITIKEAKRHFKCSDSLLYKMIKQRRITSACEINGLTHVDARELRILRHRGLLVTRDRRCLKPIMIKVSIPYTDYLLLALLLDSQGIKFQTWIQNQMERKVCVFLKAIKNGVPVPDFFKY